MASAWSLTTVFFRMEAACERTASTVFHWSLARGSGIHSGSDRPKIIGQRVRVRLVQRAQGVQPRGRLGIAAQPHPHLLHRPAQQFEVRRRQPVRALVRSPLRLIFFQTEDVAQVHQRMARHGEGQLRLARCHARHHRDQQRATIQDRGQRRQPALVVMLRAVVAQDRVGDVRLQQLGRPALPLDQQHHQRLLPPAKRVAAQQFDAGRRRSRPRVQQRNAHLAPRKRPVQHRNISNHQRHKAQPRARLAHNQRARRQAAWHHIAQPQREQRRPAHVKVRAQAANHTRSAPSHRQTACPARRAAAQSPSPAAAPTPSAETAANPAHRCCTCVSRSLRLRMRRATAAHGIQVTMVEQPRNAEPPRRTARQDDGLECVHHRTQTEHQPDHECRNAHGSFYRDAAIPSSANRTLLLGQPRPVSNSL